MLDWFRPGVARVTIQLDGPESLSATETFNLLEVVAGAAVGLSMEGAVAYSIRGRRRE